MSVQQPGLHIHRHSQVYHSHRGERLGSLLWAKTLSFNSFLQLSLLNVYSNVLALTCQVIWNVTLLCISHLSNLQEKKPEIKIFVQEHPKEQLQYRLLWERTPYCPGVTQAPACYTHVGWWSWGRSWAKPAGAKNSTLLFNFRRCWKILRNTD